MDTIDYSLVVVDEMPRAVWDWELKERNIEYLRGLDPGYFVYMAMRIGEDLEGDDAKHAALALRLTYSHALEAFFALLGATIQAPDCVPGWILMYNAKRLSNVVRKIVRGDPVITKLPIKPVSFEKLSAHIHRCSFPHPDGSDAVVEAFALLWRRLAWDYLDEKGTFEYNAIKHGFRVRPGGFTLAMGAEKVPGKRLPLEELRVIGASNFGTSFYVPETIKHPNIRLRRLRRNWNPENFGWALQLISLSMRNIVSFLLRLNGEEAESTTFSAPEDLKSFEEPWRRDVGVQNTTFDSNLAEENIVAFTEDQILETFKVK